MVRYCLCFIWSIFMVGCVVIIPVPVDKVIQEGRQYDASQLNFVQINKTTSNEIIDHIGKPTIFLKEQRILIYGLRRVDSGAYWFIAAGGRGIDGIIKSEKKEAVLFALNDDDVVYHWGRAVLKDCETWLSGAIDWAKTEKINIKRPREKFVEAVPTESESLVYFYRTRDYMYYFPFCPPAKKLFLMFMGPGEYADIILLKDGTTLLGQIHWKSYVSIKVPPGNYSFMVAPDTDCIENPNLYSVDTIMLNIAPATVNFVDVGIEAGRGIIKPVLIEKTRNEAFGEIKDLKESW